MICWKVVWNREILGQAKVGWEEKVLECCPGMASLRSSVNYNLSEVREVAIRTYRGPSRCMQRQQTVQRP